MKTILGLVVTLFVHAAAMAASNIPSAELSADNLPPEAMPVSICGIHESHTGQQDCFQLSSSSNAVCYDRSCGCHVIRSSRGCSISCNVSSCQGE